MLTQKTKRIMSFFLAFVMVFSMLPVQALATEEAATNLTAIQAQIDDILIRYLGNTEMGTADIHALVASMEEDIFWNALVEVDDLENSDAVHQLAEEEIQVLAEANTVFADFGDAVYERYADDFSIALYAAPVTPVAGISVAASGADSGPTLSEGNVKITKKGGMFNSGNANITITNTGGKKAKISFSYAHSGAGSATLDGASATTGNYSKILDANGTVTMTVMGAGGWQTGTLTLSGFSWAEVVADAAATVTYDSAKGSVSLGGSTVANGGSATVTNGTLDVVATPANGYTFIGWINSDTNDLLSSSSTATLDIPQNINLQAVFVKNDGTDTGWFNVSGAALFDNLTEACTYASGVSNKTIILMNNATLPAGNYTIPSGVTLLIPFDDANTLYTSDPKMCSGDADGIGYTTPNFYRTLTLAKGANITVNGAISLSAKVSVNFGYNGMPTGDVSRIQMNQNSSITLENGGKLYAWGYITGEGSVNAKSGSTVYECFQIKDWRGGSQSSEMENKVFAFSQYYLQNVEVPLTIHSGSALNGFFGIYSGGVYGIGAGNYAAEPAIISNGSSSLFKLSSGSITIDYIEDSDRLKLDLNGTMSIQNYTIKVSMYSMSTGNFVFPVTNNFIVNVNSGAELTTSIDAALLPGAQLNIAEGGTVSSNKNIYVYDADEWGGYCYYGGDNVKLVPLDYAPGRINARTESNLVDVAICVNGELSGCIYTTAGGANIYSTGTGVANITAGTSTTTKQFKQADYAGNPATYIDIPITPAKLKNADGKYVSTASGTYVYNAEHAKWAQTGHTFDAGVVTDPTCTEQGYTTYTCACGYSYKDNYVNANGHGESVTYHNDGDTHSATYDCCGATVLSGEAHSYENYACAKCEAVQQFTITFLNYDGTELLSTKVEYGKVPSYTGETPTKAATTEHTYSFKSWDKELVAVTGEATYTATFTEAVRTYSITWKNGDAILKTENLNYGATPSYSGETPTKDADAQYTYTFSSWSPEIVAVSADAVYTATFESDLRSYTVKFVNYNGDVLQTETLKYGETPVYKGENPTRDADAQYTYEFKSWDKDISAVNGDVTYTATYNTTTNKYVIKFVDENGTELQSSEVEFGVTPEFTGATPTKAGNAQYSYSFEGWTPAVVVVSGEATYTATYSETVNKYTIKFVNHDGTELQSGEVEYGTVPTYNGKTPTKEATAAHTYSFKSWDNELAAVTGDATYTATFTQAARTYTVTFVNEDGTQLQSGEVAYGETPEYNGATPTKAATAQYSYAFKAWDKELAAVSGDVVYTATYDATVNEYTITFVDEDGTELQSGKVAYDSKPSYTGATPTKAATAQYTYEFAGWTPEVVAVTGDATYTATYKANLNKYTVKFVNEDGSVLKEEQLEYGATPVYPENPTQKATAQYTYTFKAWDKELETVTGDVVYTATYDATVNEYTITFVDEDGTQLHSGKVAYGATPVFDGETPTKAATVQYTYEFAGWTPEIAAVTGNATYKATYSATVNKYEVRWIIDGATIHTEEVEYGSAVTHPVSAEKIGYTLTWNHSGTNITGETEINGTYTAKNFHVTWMKEDETKYTDTTATFDSKLTLPATPPTKEGYTFLGWFTAVEGGNQVTEETVYTTDADSIYYAHWQINTYSVSWVVEGETVDTDTVEHGVMPTYTGKTPEKEADVQYTYTFKGWTPAISAATGDVVYTAEFDKTVNEYTITFVDEDGTELQSGKVAYGSKPSYTGATPTKAATAQYTYKFAGWTPEVVVVTGDATYTATYTETVNSYTIIWKNNGTELTRATVDYGETPVYSGATPTKTGNAQYTYTFNGWEPEVVAVTGDATYNAAFTESVNKYTITFQDADGKEIKSVEVAYGETPVAPELTKNCHTLSWTPAITAVSGNATYKAVWTKAEHTAAEAVEENRVDATFDAPGSYESVVNCSVCGKELKRETITIDQLVAVAKVGETRYQTLAEAIDAAAEGGEITLLADVTEEVTVSKAVTIMKNGFTAKITAGDGFEVEETETTYTVAESSETERLVTIVDRGNTLMLKGMVHICQYLAFQNIDMSQEEILENAGLEIVTEKGTEYTASLVYSGPYQGYEEYYAQTDGIPAKELGDYMIFTPFISVDGVKVYGESKTYGVLDYVDKAVRTNKEALKTTLVGLLNYGSAAQTYFSYKADDLMNACLQTYVEQGLLNADYLELNWDSNLLTAAVEPSEAMSVNFPATGTITDNGKSLYLKGAISINYYKGIGHDNSAFVNATEKKMYFWTEKDYNTLASSGTPLSKDNASYSIEAGDPSYSTKYGYEYQLISDQYAAKSLGETLYSVFCIIDVNGVEHCSGVEVYSPEVFAYKAINSSNTALAAVAKWMVVYGERAKTYFS